METDLEPNDIAFEAAAGSSPEDLAAVTLRTQKLEKRHRQIQAEIFLPFPPQQVWDVLIDYESLADFIPNLSKSERLAHPDSGIRLEQIEGSLKLF